MRSIHAQRGLSFFGWLFLVAILGFAMVIGMKLFPIYMEYWTVSKILEEVGNAPDAGHKSRTVLMSTVYKHLDVNSVTTVDRRHIKIEKNDTDGRQFHLKYEVRKPLVGNVDAVVKFEKIVPIRDPAD